MSTGGATADGLDYLLNLITGGDQAVDLYYIALVKDLAPGFTTIGTELDEPDAEDYSRAMLANEAASWDLSDTVVSTVDELVFPAAISDWGQLSYWAICDDTVDNGGRVLFVGEFDLPITVLAGQQITLPPGSVGIDMSGNEWQMGI